MAPLSAIARSDAKIKNMKEQRIIKPKKSLGQNFLKSALALREIIKAGEISAEDIILEIGPGKGALTEKLLPARNATHSVAGGESSDTVIAVEKDRELVEFLKNKFATEIKNRKLILIAEDILDFDVKKFIKNKYKIIANIPYNITGAILKKFLTEKNQPERMVLLVQNEVAKRITARDGKESILSISVKAYGNPKIILKVPARYFSPAPRVDSAVLLISDISKKVFEENKLNEEKFFEILHAGFAHKRKKLSSNLKKFISLESEQWENTRAEELALKDWIALSKMIQ